METPLPAIHQREAAAGILLVLRRMRIPLIVLIVVFAVSVVGLSLVPGVDPQGRPSRMSLFESFYFMSYTATTIGFGELPYPFTPMQRMWVTVVVFLSVIGWAYAIGSLLSLMQDRAFRRSLSRRRFSRKVTNLGGPFLLLVGYGNATKRLARSLDEMGRRFVVIDDDEDRVASVHLAAYHADTPTLLGDATDTAQLVLCGLGHRHCEGVIALTGDDEANLDVAMTTALLRPDLRVVARAGSRAVADRMLAFGSPEVVNPLDRFGDHLRILLRSPASYQLMVWLTSAPGTPLPRRLAAPPDGRWAICASGRTGRELAEDLRAEGMEVTVVDKDDAHSWQASVLDSPTLADAAVVVAATASDTTNLWLVEQTRQAHPDTYLVALQNRAANESLFDVVGVDFTLVPAEIVAHEVLARLANPMLMEFLPEVPHQGEDWATQLLERLVDSCGTALPDLRRLRLTSADAPALRSWLGGGGVRLGDLLRDPGGREDSLDVVALLLVSDGAHVMTPADDRVLRDGDELLVAGRPAAWPALSRTLHDESTAAYALDGRFVPTGWLWRRLAGDGTAQ